MTLTTEVKAQTALNGVVNALRAVKRATTLANEVKSAIVAHGLATEFPSGAVASLNSWVIGLNALDTQPLLDMVISRYSASHRGMALPGEVKYEEEEEAY